MSHIALWCSAECWYVG